MAIRLQKLIVAARRFSKSQIPRGMILDGLELRPPEIHLLFSLEKGAWGKCPDSSQAGAQPSVIAGIMGVTAGNITQILTALEKRGLVERTTDPEDRRKVVISLTAAGKEAVAKAGRAYREAYSGLLAQLGEERTDEFVELLEKSAGYFMDRFGPERQVQP